MQSLDAASELTAEACGDGLDDSMSTEHRNRRGSSITEKVSSWFSNKNTSTPKGPASGDALVSAIKDHEARPTLGTLPETDPAFVARLVEFYTEYNPTKVDSAATTAAKWQGNVVVSFMQQVL